MCLTTGTTLQLPQSLRTGKMVGNYVFTKYRLWLVKENNSCFIDQPESLALAGLPPFSVQQHPFQSVRKRASERASAGRAGKSVQDTNGNSVRQRKKDARTGNCGALRPAANARRFDDCGLYLRLMAFGRSDTFIGRDSPSAVCTSAMPGALNGAYTYRYYATRYPV